MREPDVEGMLRRMSMKQFARWVWYSEIEAFGSLRDDYHAAQIVGMIHNVNVKQEHQKGTSEFLLKFVHDPEAPAAPPAAPQKQTVAEQVQILNILAHAWSVPGVVGE